MMSSIIQHFYHSTSSQSQILRVFISTCCILTMCEGFAFIMPQQPQHMLLSPQRSPNDRQRQQCHQRRQGMRSIPARPSVLLFSSVSKNRDQTAKKRRNSKSKGGTRRGYKKPGKWDRRRRGGKDDAARLEAAAARPRPVLTQYDEQRNRRVNERRLRTPAADVAMEEFVPAGVMDRTVGDVEVIRSAKRFFSSAAVRRGRIDAERSGEDWVVEEEDDGFYEVVAPSETTGWRTQAKLAAAPASGGRNRDGCKFGLYKRGTHQVVEIPNCNVHHPSINKAVEALQKATKRTGTPACTDDGGGLRYAQFQVERTTGKISLVLVWGASTIKGTQPALSRLAKELLKSEPDLWHSMWCHCNDGPGNNIFSRNPKSWHRLSGHEFVREPLPVGDLGWLYFSPLAFRQGNLDGFDIIANDVARAVPGGSKVCELYAGVGMLGLTSLVYHHFEHQDGYGDPLTWVRCSDENPANPRCFSASVRSL